MLLMLPLLVGVGKAREEWITYLRVARFTADRLLNAAAVGGAGATFSLIYEDKLRSHVVLWLRAVVYEDYQSRVHFFATEFLILQLVFFAFAIQTLVLIDA